MLDNGTPLDQRFLETIADRILGITWGYTVAICSLAYIGKFGGCTLASRWAGFSWREASTIGSLMSCKGSVHFRLRSAHFIDAQRLIAW